MIGRARGSRVGGSRARLGRTTWNYIACAVLLLIAALLAWKWTQWQARAAVGAAYGARITCSCRYVEGRSAQSCTGDTEPGMEIVGITDHPESRAVTGSVAMMASRTARYRPGFGCLLDAE